MDASLIFLIGVAFGVLASTLGKSYIKMLLQGFQPADVPPQRFEDYWDADTYTFRIGKFIQYSKDPGNNLYTATINASLFKAIVDVMDKKEPVVLDFSEFNCPDSSASTTIDVVKHMREVIFNKTGLVPTVYLGISATTPVHVSDTLRKIRAHALS